MELSHLLHLVSELPTNSSLNYVRGSDQCSFLNVDLENIRINAKAPNGEAKSWAPSYLKELAPLIYENEPFNLSGLLNNKGTYRPVLETIIAHTREFYWVKKGSAVEIVWVPSKPKQSLVLTEIVTEDIPAPLDHANKITTQYLPKDELIAKVRESFKRYWDLIDQSGASIDHYTSQFETTFAKFLPNLGLGIENVFQIVDFAQFCTITERLIAENSEIAFLKNYKENHGWRYEVGRAQDLYRNFLEILSFSDFRANIDKQQERIVAVVSSAVDNSQISYLRAMRTKPFLLLAGISGTGKSRIVKQLAFKSCPDKDGLRKDPTSPGNYCLVEVKPNWHDSTELLGYQSQIKNGYVLTPFVKFLAKAMLHPDTPFFVCLDEMNLAPVEQYFAEFLSVLESRKKHGDHITSEALVPASVFEAQDLIAELFGLKKQTPSGYGSTTADVPVSYGQESAIYDVLKRDGLRIPENVIVIGTVNMDETTHQFSRKVIDRAMTIEMNIADGTEPFSNFFEKYEDLGYSENPLLKELFLPKYVSADQALAEMDPETVAFLKTEVPVRLAALNEALNGTPFKIAYRVQNELVLYFASLLADSPEAAKEDLLTQAIDGILMMKVLPRIEGDEDLLKKPLDKLADFAASYPLSAEKIKEMQERLERGHFTSFWP